MSAFGAETLAGCSVLLAGESWVSQSLHAKGFVSYTTSSYEEGAEALIAALRRAGAELTYISNHAAPESFPRSEAELEPFDVVILSDIASDSLLLERACLLEGVRAPNRLQALARHVHGGAGLAMVGGYMSFSGIEGKARYGMTALADVLPVQLLSYDDRLETPEGVVPETARPDHPILAGVESEWPYFLGYNKLKTKEGADLIMFCGGDPFLVVQEVGQGRTAAFASDCSPHWGSRAFLSWGSYARFWAQLVAWLARRRTEGANA